MIRRLITLLIPMLALTHAEAAPDGSMHLDDVWAGHPVGFDILTERGHQFVAYYDKDRRITVLGRKIDSPDWQRVQPEGVFLPKRGRPSNVTDWDSHNYLRMALDRDGHLHLSGNLHNDPLIYYRTTRPFDVTSLERLDRMTGIRESNTTYPVFFRNASGDLIFRYRDGGSGNGSDLYNIYDERTRSWSPLLTTPLLDGQGERNAYALHPTLGPDGRFHLVWMWRDTPDCSTNHSLSYARSRDLLSWERADGTPIPLPITLVTGDVVDPSPVKGGLINMTFNIGFDAEKRPVIVYHRYDSNGKSQAYAARFDPAAASWRSVQVSDWEFRWQFSGGGSIDAEVTLGAPRLSESGRLLIDYNARKGPGAGRWELDAETLSPLRSLPPPKRPAVAGVGPVSKGMEVQTRVSRSEGRAWMLRWETLPRNRDRPRDSAPPPSRLMLYPIADTDLGEARHVGS